MYDTQAPGTLRGVGLAALVLISACSDDPVGGMASFSEISCSIPQALIFNGGPGKDGIPALTNPTLVSPGDPGTGYLQNEDRVVGLVLEQGPVAIPLNIFWWHEIVNLDLNGPALAITHCPLTGSSMGFDRAAAGGVEFGVSGLLYQNNLIMYDRSGSESLWPQMLRGARCGQKDGTALPMVPLVEMTWEGWRTLHPQTLVVSGDTPFNRDYTAYPYGNYDEPNNSALLFPTDLDDRRPPKERVLGLPLGTGGITFPFGLLDDRGALAAVPFEFRGEALVVLWDRFRQAAMVYKATLGEQELTFESGADQIVDEQTGSVWRVDGTASSGPLAGKSLEPVSEGFVAYWFAWPAFYPDIDIWSGS